ncbi:MAG TPA: heme exporter protein CcmB [Longimicrobiales bacterium]|nr:heme exporter protein CcmB [Longimicrobiales bacterium]
MSVRAEAGRVAAVAWKDLTTERRSKANFNAVLFLAALMLLMFGFALGPDTATLRTAAAGIVWLTVLFSGNLAFHRSYQTELEGGALEMLLLYPGSRSAIFLGKLLANLAFVLLIEAVLIPIAVVLYDIPLGRETVLVPLVVFLGTLGFVTLGTFYASMASRSRAREVLLPLLLFPMLVPILIAAVEATGALLGGDLMGDSGSWIRLLIAFDVIFLGAAMAAFGAVIEE